MNRRSFIQSVIGLLMAKLPTVHASEHQLPLSSGTSIVSPCGHPSPCFDDDCTGTSIKVIGVGDAGSNAIETAMQRGIRGVDFIAINTDVFALERSSAPSKVLLGKRGEGARAQLEIGRAATNAYLADIRAALAGAHMAFIVAGLGGETGTGVAPVVAEIAREMGILTVGVVTTPFSFEGQRRMAAANVGASELVEHLDSLILIQNDKLMASMDESTDVDVCFKAADGVLTSAVKGIAEIITCLGIVGCDFEDVRTVMGDIGLAALAFGSASGVNRARIAAEQAIASPLQDGANLAAARGLLVAITSGKGQLKMREVNEVMSTIRLLANEEAQIIFGAIHDDAMGDALNVTLVTTGIGSASAAYKAKHRAFSAAPQLREADIDRYDIPPFLMRS